MENVMGLYKSIAETPMQKLMYDQGKGRTAPVRTDGHGTVRDTYTVC